MRVCYRRLCKAEAVHAVNVGSAWARCVFFPGNEPENLRHYELCADHFRSYFPRGLGWLDHLNATRLRVQCVSAEPPEAP